MLSRRNIRIKVMQVLYSMNRDTGLDINEALRQYWSSVNRSFELYIFNLWYLIRVADFAKEDQANKRSKHLPTADDLNFEAKLGENEMVRSLAENKGLLAEIKKYQISEKIDTDIVRRLYTEFARSPEYKAYLQGEEDHVQALLNLFKYMMNSELFEDLVEDFYPTWIDDQSLIVGSIKKTLKALPAEGNFLDEYRPTDETTKEFGEVLLRCVCDKDQDWLALIEPTLKNWDVERVAIIDMILLKMALCELTTFPTIPTKVTINEFVEISKLYSTDKSKDFINGVLDRLMKQMQQDGLIKKEGRGLIE